MTLILTSEFSVSFAKTKAILASEKLISNRAIFIPTAGYGEDWEPGYEDNIKPLEDIGLTVTSFDLRDKTETQVRAALHNAAVISVAGGNTFFLLEHMKKSGFTHAIHDALAKGAIYIGSSAGSIVCAPDIAYIDVMDDPKRANLSDTKGLGLIDFLFLPHLGENRQSEAARKRCATYSDSLPLLALTDDQLLYVKGKVVRVI